MTHEEQQEFENRMRRFENGLDHLLELMASILEAQARAGQHIRALAASAATHQQRLDPLEDRS